MKLTIRKIAYVAVFAAACLCVSCAPKERAGKTADGERTTITATFYPLYIMLLNVTDGVENVSLSLLAPPDTGCLHDYQLTTKDMLLLEKSDIIVANGAGMESFIEKVLQTRGDSVIQAAEGADLLYGENALRQMEANPHVWVSVDGAKYEVLRIAEELGRLDPGNAVKYEENASSYANRLDELSMMMREELSPYKGGRIITFHEAFPYFAREFDLTIAGIVEREPGTEPTARELLETIDIIKEARKEGVRVALFAEPQYTPSAARIIAAETGLTVYELDPGVTGPLDKDAYIAAMERNTETLKAALGKHSE